MRKQAVRGAQLTRALSAIEAIRVAELQCEQARRIRDDAIYRLVHEEGYPRSAVAAALGLSYSHVTKAEKLEHSLV